MYVQKTGDTMTGPLVLPGDPTAPLQAAEKQYVDAQVAGVAGGGAGKVSSAAFCDANCGAARRDAVEGEQPEWRALCRTVREWKREQRDYECDRRRTDCTAGCDVRVEQTNVSTETVQPTHWANGTQVEDRRLGTDHASFFNPNGTGVNIAEQVNVTSTETAPQLLAAGGGGNQFWTGLQVNSTGLTGGSNEYPKLIQGTVPYFKTTYTGLSLNGTYNTPGQHVLSGYNQNCYGVGDCLMGGMFMTASGGFRDDADEGSHPFDLIFNEDTNVFVGSCSTGCTTGSTTVQVAATSGAGTQGEGRYLIDKNPAKTITAGSVIGGSSAVGSLPVATFTGTSFPLSTFVETAQTIPTQANAIAPGTVSVAILTAGVPAGYLTSTAGISPASGVACVSDPTTGDSRPSNFETANYTVVDGTHVQLTLHRAHATGATVAVGGLCGYGLEQTVDTQAGSPAGVSGDRVYLYDELVLCGWVERSGGCAGK